MVVGFDCAAKNGSKMTSRKHRNRIGSSEAAGHWKAIEVIQTTQEVEMQFSTG